MIPRSIRIDGFLSYRTMEEAISFVGVRLWMLCGPNGAGKSSIFDAMTFALYGVHRAGNAQNYGGLLHRGSDRLSVEFEFSIGGSDYRILRTRDRTRSGNPTFQAWKRVNGSWKTIDGTQTEDGLLDWVQSRDVMGMKANAFLSSVLLRQGEADRLLRTKRDERFSVLSQIIDLSRYQDLYKRVDERRADRRRDATRLQKEHEAEQKKLEALTPDPLAEIAALQATESEAERLRDAASAQVESMVVLKTHAAAWERLCKEQTGLLQAEQEAQELLAQAAKIEREAHRLTKLTEALPRLRALLGARLELARKRAEVERLRTPADQAQQQAAAAKTLRDQAQSAWQQLDQEDRALLQRENAAGLELQALAPAIEELRQREKDGEDAARLGQVLLAYPADLDQQCAAAKAELEAVRLLTSALPPLEQFARARGDWRKAMEEANKARSAQEQARQRLEATCQERQAQEQVVEALAEVAGQSLRVLQEAEARLAEVQERIERFKQTKDAPECLFCGQKLPETHRSRHEKELLDQWDGAQSACEQALQAYRDAESAHEAAETERRQITSREQAETGELRQAETTRERWEMRADTARENAREVRQALPEPYARRIEPSAGAAVEACLAQPYPDERELHELRQRVASLPAKVKEVDQLTETIEARDGLMVQKAQAEQRRDAPREHLWDRTPEQIRSAYDSAAGEQKAVRDSRSDLEPRLEMAQKRSEEAEATLTTAETSSAEAASRLEQAVQAEAATAQTEATAQALLPEDWHEAAATLTKEQLTGWEEEAGRLSGADDRLVRLNQARSEAERRRHRLSDLQRDLQTIPEEARRPAAELALEEQQAREEAARAEESRRTARNRREQIERLQELIESKEKQRREAASEERLCRRLAELLDSRSGLQRDLLRRAVRGVVTAANDVLDRLSAARLRIDLTEDGEALDLVATRQGESGDPYDVDFLSGSERFRIAVSLALGIGHYASLTGERVPCVIIDEGFGCLDEDSRHDMIDALHDLKEHLEMIIVVSHQREFYDRFPNRYMITRENGASRVALALQE